MLKRAYNSFTQIRQATKDVIEKNQSTSLRRSFIFSFSLSPLLFLLSFVRSLNVKEEHKSEWTEVVHIKNTHDDFQCTIDRSHSLSLIIAMSMIALEKKKETVRVCVLTSQIANRRFLRLSISFLLRHLLNFLFMNDKNKYMYEKFRQSLFSFLRRSFLLFELEMCLCCNNKTVIIVKFFSYVTILAYISRERKKSIGHHC